MHRRDFLTSAAALVTGGLTPAAQQDNLKKLKITKITAFRNVSPRPKLACHTGEPESWEI